MVVRGKMSHWRILWTKLKCNIVWYRDERMKLSLRRLSPTEFRSKWGLPFSPIKCPHSLRNHYFLQFSFCYFLIFITVQTLSHNLHSLQIEWPTSWQSNLAKSGNKVMHCFGHFCTQAPIHNNSLFRSASAYFINPFF